MVLEVARREPCGRRKSGGPGRPPPERLQASGLGADRLAEANDRSVRARGSGGGAGPDAVQVVVRAAGGRLVPRRAELDAVAGLIGALAVRTGDDIGGAAV